MGVTLFTIGGGGGTLALATLGFGEIGGVVLIAAGGGGTGTRALGARFSDCDDALGPNVTDGGAIFPAFEIKGFPDDFFFAVSLTAGVETAARLTAATGAALGDGGRDGLTVADFLISLGGDASGRGGFNLPPNFGSVNVKDATASGTASPVTVPGIGFTPLEATSGFEVCDVGRMWVWYGKSSH